MNKVAMDWIDDYYCGGPDFPAPACEKCPNGVFWSDADGEVQGDCKVLYNPKMNEYDCPAWVEKYDKYVK